MSLSGRAATGAKWSVASVAGRHVVLTLTTLILAKLLAPADFGLVALAAIFTRFIDLVRDMGTGSGIVQIADPDDVLLSSVFWLNVGLGIVGAGALYFAAPSAAMFFGEPRLADVLRVLAISPILAGVGVVPTSLLTRQMQFRRLASVELAGAIAGGVVGIVLAARGGGVWSLVWQTITSVLLISAGVCAACSWRPRFLCRLSSVRPILGYSANLAGVYVLGYVVRYSDNVLVGRYLGAENLGLYDMAYRTMLVPLQYLSTAFGRAVFPVYSRMQGDLKRLGVAYLRVVGAVSLIAIPVLLGLAAIARPLVVAALGPAWLPVASLLLIFGPVGALQVISSTGNLIFQAIGRTDVFLRWFLASAVLIVVAFVVGLRWGILGVAGAYAVVSFALTYPSFKIPLSLIELPMPRLAAAIWRPAACGILMFLSLILLAHGFPPSLSERAQLAVLVPVGALIYAGATWLLNRDGAAELIGAVRSA